MSTEKRVPEIRFKGFSGEWNSFSLEEISDVLDGDRGHNYPNGEDLKEQGHTLFLSASNVTKNGFKFDTRQYITKEKSGSLGNGKLFVGDIILTSRGSIGHIAWYNEDVTKEVPFARINSGMLILRVKSHIAPSVISQYLKSPKGKKKIEGISFGSAQPQLTKASVSKFSISIPIEKTEQTAIGNTFQKLDSLINQHQQKHDKLSNLKKAMLVKMFPKQGETIPEVRFEGFSGAWRETDLASACSNFQSGKFLKAEDIKKNGAYPVYGGNGLRGFCSEYNHEGTYALIGRQGALCGNMNLSHGKAFFTEHAIAVQANKDCDTLFLFYKLGTMNLGQYSGQSAQPGLSVTNLIKLIIYVPEYREQTKIGNYFQKLDTLINQHQQQIIKLNNIKQACLSKMFV